MGSAAVSGSLWSHRLVLGAAVLLGTCAATWVLAAHARLVTVAGVAQSAPKAEPELGRVPDFSLIDDQGRAISRQGLLGFVWVADFMFTRCAGQCPMLSAQMARLQTAFRTTPGIQFISFSVDSAHDTAEVLGRYARYYRAPASRWRFVTGESQAVSRLVEDGFHLGVSDGASAAEPITHSLRFVLVDQEARLQGYYDATDARAMARLEADARRLLRGPSAR